jgi:hypothetical protein
MQMRVCRGKPCIKRKEQVMLSRHPALAGLLIALVFSLGCASRPFEENWGTAFDLTMEAQVLDPDAGQCADPVTGLDGEAASSEMKKYRKSFTTEKKADAKQSGGVFMGSGKSR